MWDPRRVFLPWGFPAGGTLCRAVHPGNEVYVGGVLHRPLWGCTRGDEKAPASQGCRAESVAGPGSKDFSLVTVCSAASGSLGERNK